MPLTLLFLHGWAFDASLWRKVLPQLDAYNCVIADRGYFGAPAAPAVSGPVVVVAHSLGAMLALESVPADCRGMIAVGGFDRFVAAADAPGVSPRIVERMLGRLDTQAEQVVGEFRRRCGEGLPTGPMDVGRLRMDLRFLHDGDCRTMSAAATFPILSLQGADDPILPADLRDAAFRGAPLIQSETCPGAGHVLPLSHAEWFAGKVADFVRTSL